MCIPSSSLAGIAIPEHFQFFLILASTYRKFGRLSTSDVNQKRLSNVMFHDFMRKCVCMCVCGGGGGDQAQFFV